MARYASWEVPADKHEHWEGYADGTKLVKPAWTGC